MWITRPSRSFTGTRNPWVCQSCHATFPVTYAAYTTIDTNSFCWPIGSTSASAVARCAMSSSTRNTTIQAVVANTG